MAFKGTVWEIRGKDETGEWVLIVSADAGGWIGCDYLEVLVPVPIATIMSGVALVTRVPIKTATAVGTAVPSPDFVFTRVRLLSIQENGGCLGMHNFLIGVRDAAGHPLDGITVELFWEGANPTLKNVSGSKAPGYIDQPVQPGDFRLRVTRDATADRPVTSQVSRLMRTGNWPSNEWDELKAAGYPPPDDLRFYCWGHYSWDVEIQRTW